MIFYTNCIFIQLQQTWLSRDRTIFTSRLGFRLSLRENDISIGDIMAIGTTFSSSMFEAICLQVRENPFPVLFLIQYISILCFRLWQHKTSWRAPVFPVMSSYMHHYRSKQLPQIIILIFRGAWMSLSGEGAAKNSAPRSVKTSTCNQPHSCYCPSVPSFTRKWPIFTNGAILVNTSILSAHFCG